MTHVRESIAKLSSEEPVLAKLQRWYGVDLPELDWVLSLDVMATNHSPEFVVHLRQACLG